MLVEMMRRKKQKKNHGMSVNRINIIYDSRLVGCSNCSN
jgi:hypothetical protein